MAFNFQVVLLVLNFLGLLILSFFVYSLYSHYNNLSKGISQRTLKSILDDILEEQKIGKTDLAQLKERCDTIEKEGLSHIQKVGLLRFNPFKDTGGDQSFIVALLDGTNTGLVISGLYSRSGTRWYAKRIVSGKSIDHELSDEEKKALKEAKAIET